MSYFHGGSLEITHTVPLNSTIQYSVYKPAYIYVFHVQRLGAAAAEMEYGETKGNFHTIIVNDSLENAYSALRTFILPDIEAIKAKQGTAA